MKTKADETSESKKQTVVVAVDEVALADECERLSSLISQIAC